MKRILILILCCLLLAGCGATTSQPEPTATETKPVDTMAPTETEPQTTPQPVVLTYQIYLPNENADGFDVQAVETDQITANGVLEALQAQGALPETVSINAFDIDGSQLNIDFNQGFADLICSMGTSGELMITGSVVNSFLSAFQAESVYFTVDGEILESGHVVYDFPLTFVE